MSGAEPDCEARGTLVMEKAGVEAPPVIWGPDAESRYCMECAGASPVVWGAGPGGLGVAGEGVRWLRRHRAGHLLLEREASSGVAPVVSGCFT